MTDEKKQPKVHPVLDRTTSFIRAHDLDLTEEDLAEAANDGDEQRTDIVSGGNKKELLSLGGKSGSGAIMSALVTIGLHETTDESDRWSAVSATDKILKKRAKQLKKKKGKATADDGSIMGPWTNAAAGNDVFVWSSKCTRPGHGSEYPVVKSRGLIPASARDVVELIRDSGRVTEYNKMSVGREDQVVLTREDSGASVHCSVTKCPELGVPGEAKIMSSKSKPPLVRKPLEFKTLFYARQLTEEDGVEMVGVAYVTVGRSVWESSEGTAEGSDGSTTRCEIMLSVNLVREIKADNEEAWCELTSITHAVSPGVPVFIGKQLGLAAAESYIKDIRALFEK
eukprot:CAMPEP_0172553396 /NCGR_PEP_ID=MMETSP1067-20121228/50625_1 /TAXON_ID=265564 ORGANISM="Thalassiosira punctigera, Strain Tpunct2005C2" /NCGR_SAMPLE_ID=MMETSP1067 /ASSEMBLY_ACC=CAM_ASM_000444 /LENGTH=339 /DNA_ID=CAMNT_0013341573 /DNA_START=327 /DNA_END=1346 /DNA_ORIENTATION=+